MQPTSLQFLAHVTVLADAIPASELSAAATGVQLAPEAVLNILLQVANADDDSGGRADTDVVERVAVLRGREILVAGKNAKGEIPACNPEFMLGLLLALSGEGSTQELLASDAHPAELKVVAGILRRSGGGGGDGRGRNLKSTLEFLLWGPWSPAEGPWGPLGCESGEDGREAAAHLERWLHLERATLLNSMLGGRWEGGGLLTGQAALSRDETARLGFLVEADPDNLKDALDSVYAELRALNDANL